MHNLKSTSPREFTDVFVRGYKNNLGKRIEIRDTKVTGLVLRVTPSNKKTFTLQTRTKVGEKVQITLGGYPVLSVKEARGLATQHLADIKRGNDPREKIQVARARAEVHKLTLAELLDEVEPIFGATRAMWREGNRAGRTKPEARAAIDNVFKQLLQMPLGKLSQSDFSRAVRRYIPKRPKQGKVTANGAAARALAYLCPVLDWASGRGAFQKENSGRTTKLDLPDLARIQDPSINDPSLEVKRERVLLQDELVRIMPVLTYPAPVGMRPRLDPRSDFGPIAYRFLLLTLARREEVENATRKDFDMSAGTWTRSVKTRRRPGAKGPAGRRIVTVPLSRAAMELLCTLPTFVEGQPDDFVFPSSQGGVLGNWGRIQDAINRASGTSGWHRHDLRRTGATIMKQLGVAPAVIDNLLGHVNPLNREQVSSAAANYLIDTKVLHEAVDHERVAVELLAQALESICQPIVKPSVAQAEKPTQNRTKMRKTSPWADHSLQ